MDPKQMLRFATLMATWLYLHLGVAFGEGVSVRGGVVTLSGFGELDVEQTLQHWEDQQRAEMQSLLAMHIALLTEVCELSPPVVEKLQLAAKGVCTRQIASGRRQLEDFIYASGLAQREEEPPVVVPLDRLQLTGAGRVRQGVVAFEGQFERSLLDHPLWIKVLKSSLSSTQYEQFVNEKIRRNRSRLVAAVAKVVVQLDQQVVLSELQAKKAHQELIDSLESQVTQQFPQTLEEAQQVAEQQAEQEEVLAKFLRPDQLRRAELLRAKPRVLSVRWTNRGG